MGIKNLLKTLKSIAKRKSLESYRNKKVAIDGYSWLHKSVYSLGQSILSSKPDLTQCMVYLRRRILSLQKFNITPVVVFDGAKLPMKLEEENFREKSRERLNKEAQDLLKKNDIGGAIKKAILGFDITPEFAYEFIKILKKERIEYFVAPYEADLQLAYLSKINYVDFVITEDSDLLALGCKTVLYKLDKFELYYGEEIRYEDIKKCWEFDFSRFSQDDFLMFCILSGCDYFKIKSVGSKTAYYAVKENSNYKQMIMSLYSKSKNINTDFSALIRDFEKAFTTFKYQVIYCPIEKRMKNFSDISKTQYDFVKNFTDLSFLGTVQDEKITQEIVTGVIDPITHKRLGDQPVKPEPEPEPKPTSKSKAKIPSSTLKKKGKKKKQSTNPKLRSLKKDQSTLDFFINTKDKKPLRENIPNSSLKQEDVKEIHPALIHITKDEDEALNTDEKTTQGESSSEIFEIKSKYTCADISTQDTGLLSLHSRPTLFNKKRKFNEYNRDIKFDKHERTEYNYDFDSVLLKYNCSLGNNPTLTSPATKAEKKSAAKNTKIESQTYESPEKRPTVINASFSFEDYCFNPEKELENF